MLPPTVTLNPAASSIRPVSAVVVDLPFVPVIAITRPCSQRDASSISPITGTPRSRAACDRRLLGRHAGTQHDQVGAGERLRPVSAELELDAQSAQRLALRRPRSRVGQRHARAAARQQLRGGHAASRRARDASRVCPSHRNANRPDPVTAASTSSG